MGFNEKLPVDAGVTVSVRVVVAVRVPEVPVNVITELPAVAEQPTLMVIVEAPEIGLEPNPTVTPLGNPDAVTATEPVNPFCGVSVRVTVPEPHWGMVIAGGDTESAKLAGVVELTVSAMLVAAVRFPDVPVMVTLASPAVAVALAVNLSTLEPVVGLVANAAVTPLGKPEATRVTLPVNPPASITMIVSVALLPSVTARVAAEDDSVKVGGGGVVPVTVRTKVVDSTSVPEIPLMVIV